MDNIYENLDTDREILKSHLGKHKNNCTNYIDNLFEETSSKIEYIKTCKRNSADTANKLSPLKKSLESLLKFSNDLNTDIQVLTDSSDEFIHTAKECKITEKLKNYEIKVKSVCDITNDCALKLNELKLKIDETEKIIKECEKTHGKNAKIKFVNCSCAEKLKGGVETTIAEKAISGASSLMSLGLPIASSNLHNSLHDFETAKNNEHAFVFNSADELKDKEIKETLKKINISENSRGVVYDSQSNESKKLFNSKEIQEYIIKNFSDLKTSQKNTITTIEFKKDKDPDAYLGIQHCKLINPKITSDGYFEATVVDYYDFSYRNGQNPYNAVNNKGYMLQEKGLLENQFNIYYIRGNINDINFFTRLKTSNFKKFE